MSLTHRVMERIVLMALSLCLPVWSVHQQRSVGMPAVKVIQPYKVVSTNGEAQVPCFVQPQSGSYPYPEPEELRVTLLKGLHSTPEVSLCSVMLKTKEQTREETGKEGEVQCSAQMSEGTVELTVSGLKATDTDIYRCEIEVFYPPPYLRLRGNGTLIHVLESSDCPVQEAEKQIARWGDEEVEGDDERIAPVNIVVVVLVILVIFVLLIMIYMQTLQWEQGRRDNVRLVPGVHHKVDAVPFSCENMA